MRLVVRGSLSNLPYSQFPSNQVFGRLVDYIMWMRRRLDAVTEGVSHDDIEAEDTVKNTEREI